MKSPAQTDSKAPTSFGLFPGASQKLQRVWCEESRRLHQLAVEIAHLPEGMQSKRLDSLEQWERLQVLDEIRHHVAE